MKTKPASKKSPQQIKIQQGLIDPEADQMVNQAFNISIDTIATMLEVNRNEVWRMLKLDKIIGFFWGLYRENKLTDHTSANRRR
ncbi:MAG: hypothetical protein ACD_12C00439G0001 [uncultured bacterium]|nr:MAG: hypothetical protein ACD_12C00439G0001 [uncultured bacterium]